MCNTYAHQIEENADFCSSRARCEYDGRNNVGGKKGKKKSRKGLKSWIKSNRMIKWEDDDDEERRKGERKEEKGGVWVKETSLVVAIKRVAFGPLQVD